MYLLYLNFNYHLIAGILLCLLTASQHWKHWAEISVVIYLKMDENIFKNYRLDFLSVLP